MIRWEYLILYVNPQVLKDEGEGVQKDLNTVGDVGWELVSSHDESESPYGRTFYLKRPKQEVTDSV